MSKDIPDITIDMDKKCVECNRGGATGSGICMSCILRATQGKPMRSAQGRAVQRKFESMGDNL